MKIELFDGQGGQIRLINGDSVTAVGRSWQELIEAALAIDIPDFGYVFAGVIVPAEKLFLLRVVNHGARSLSGGTVCGWEIVVNGQNAREFQREIKSRIVSFMRMSLERHKNLSLKFAVALEEFMPDKAAILFL